MHAITTTTSVAVLVTLGLALAAQAADPATRDSAVKSRTILLDGPDWRIATDPGNQGRGGKWFEAVRPEARKTPVPWVIQNIFPKYHGVAWYWRSFAAPANPHVGGRYLLSFQAVLYLADVWLNGRHLGRHEGGETPFVLDATEAIRPGEDNLLTIRVLNPTQKSIDGIRLSEVPHGHADTLYPGGVVGSVELRLVPSLRVADLHAIPDWKTGEILIKVAVHNAAAPTDIKVDVAAAFADKTVAQASRSARAGTGESVVEAIVKVPDHRLWSPDSPSLYRLAVETRAAGSASVDQASRRIGFRDFRYDNGYFRLNGRRILLKGLFYHAAEAFPITYVFPHDPTLVQRDVEILKAAGCNIVRIFNRSCPPLVERCDEAGILVWQAHYGAWRMSPSPEFKARWNRSVTEVIRRDRNHPSIVVWELSNEGGPQPPGTMETILPILRELDPTRMVWNNSGGPYCNPGEIAWRSDLQDGHPYHFVPITAQKRNMIRQEGTGQGKSVNEEITDVKPGTIRPGMYQKDRRFFLTEYGIPGPMDYASVLAEYRRLGHEHDDWAQYILAAERNFLADWKRWEMDQIWKDPKDYVTDGWRRWSRLRESEAAALRSNRSIVGLIGTVFPADMGPHSWSLTDRFRRPRDPAVMEVMRLNHAPIRWCLFATPDNVYRGAKVRFEAVLADEDTLKAGIYQARVEILGPDRRALAARAVEVRVMESAVGKERPLAFPVFDEEIAVDGPAGAYTFSIALMDRKDIPGGRLTFHVDDPATMPAIPGEVVLWGKSPALAEWLTAHQMKPQPWEPAARRRQIVLVGAEPPAPGGKEAFAELARRIARGDCAIFLDPAVFAETVATTDGRKRVNAGRWMPLAGCRMNVQSEGYRIGHRWSRQHPLLKDLPCGGMLDDLFYGELITPLRFMPPRGATPEVVIGSGPIYGNPYGTKETLFHVGVSDLGAGRFILNSFNIVPNLGRHPAAERLLRNMINYAARDNEKPLADLPANFGGTLKAMGYE